MGTVAVLSNSTIGAFESNLIQTRKVYPHSLALQPCQIVCRHLHSEGSVKALMAIRKCNHFPPKNSFTAFVNSAGRSRFEMCPAPSSST
jgi:hypothetical protein